MKDFILSFIVPKKIERHRDMNLFISVLLFLLSFIICCSIPGFRVKSMVKANYLSDCLVYEGTYEAELQNPVELPRLDIKDNVANYVDVDALTQNVYDLVYKTEDGSTINLKVVYELDKEKDDALTHIDLNEYLNVNPFDENKELKSQDILVVYTRDAFYYIYNHGYSIEYSNSSEEAKLEDYNYLMVKEWAEEGQWSFYKADKSKKDDNGLSIFRDYYFLPKFEQKVDGEGNPVVDSEGNPVLEPVDDLNDKNTWSDVSFDSEKYVMYDGIKYTGYRKVTNYIYDIFQYGVTNNLGKFTYEEMDNYSDHYYNNNNPLEAYSDIFVGLYGESMRSYNYLTGFIYIVVLPLLWMVAIYLIMHKNGELTRFREYYSVASVSFLLPSIVMAIIGMFVPYYRLASFYMIVHAGYFLFVVARINKLGKNKNDDDVEKPSKKKVVEVEANDYAVETKPAADYNSEHNFQKPSQVE